jgi:hypothetical protein
MLNRPTKRKFANKSVQARMPFCASFSAEDRCNLLINLEKYYSKLGKAKVLYRTDITTGRTLIIESTSKLSKTNIDKLTAYICGFEHGVIYTSPSIKEIN